MQKEMYIRNPRFSGWEQLLRRFDNRSAKRIAEQARLKPAKSGRLNVASYCLDIGTARELKSIQWVLIGFADDRGIFNNYGNPGAVAGPDAFRENFYGHPIAELCPDANSILDLGNIKLKALAGTLNNLARAVNTVYHFLPGVRVLVCGGGHDGAYGEVLGGLLDSIARGSEEEHHIFNGDAHSDIRELERGKVISSGTPFYRLLMLGDSRLPGQNYHPFGLQTTTNAPKLAARLRKHAVDVHWLEDMPTSDEQIQAFKGLLDKFKGRNWHLNIDLDCFPRSIAPGVSARQVFGLDPNFILALRNGGEALASLMSLGIYELSPPRDEEGKTAQLAGKIGYMVVSSTSGRRSV